MTDAERKRLEKAERERDAYARALSEAVRERDALEDVNAPEIATQAFLETIAHYQKSPLVGAKFAVEVLQGLLTRIEQEIANRGMLLRKGAK